MKKSILLCLCLLWTCILFIGCTASKNADHTEEDYDPNPYSDVKNHEDETGTDEKAKDDIDLVEKDAVTKDDDTHKEEILISPEGNTLATRINPPKNYERIEANANSFTSFTRNLTLKEDGSPILLYNGDKKNNQSSHVAVFDMEVGKKDLQQCADSIIRLYAEYYWSIEEYDKIAFHLTNNFLMEYVKWRDGYRLSVSGNDTSWVKSAEYDDTYENLLSYLERVFMYAGTLSLDSEGTDISLEEIAVGDMFIQGGSPGHCVLVIDMVENSQGDKAFLLAQGYMPAQEFHVIINPKHQEDPWYYDSEISYPLKTPEWTFDEGSLERWFQ